MASSRANTNMLLAGIRDLLIRKPENLLPRLERMFKLLDAELSSNGQLPTDWANAVKPIVMVTQHSEPGKIHPYDGGH